MHIPRPPLAARYRSRLPRPTARLRLTALYGVLFLVCATALIGTIYLLLARVAKPDISSAAPGHIQGVFAQAVHQGAQTKGGLFSLEELLIEASIALAIVSVAAFALSWLAAGRILRPLATITATARQVSATSLHERLRLPGPRDELKELADTLDSLFDRLECSFTAHRHFVANASHELRTPISRERAMLQVALDDPGTTAEEWRWTSREVLASNSEQERVIEALLTLARGEGGLECREPVDLSAVTEEVLLARRTETSRLALDVEVIIEPALLHGDAVLTERLVANLVDNAIRHNVPAGRVRITTGTSRSHAVLSVSSTGPVIPPDQVDRLFQPFQRLHPRRKGNGHGLGLSIVRAVATAHGATIAAQAPPGGGLSISVTFPPVPTPRPAPSTRHGSGRTALNAPADP